MKLYVFDNILWMGYLFQSQNTITVDKRTHGSMLVPVVSSSDKTTVSIATGNQEYHPVYQSPGNISNIAQHAHGNAVLPMLAF